MKKYLEWQNMKKWGNTASGMREYEKVGKYIEWAKMNKNHQNQHKRRVPKHNTSHKKPVNIKYALKFSNLKIVIFIKHMVFYAPSPIV